jgi:hypothetical protein
MFKIVVTAVAALAATAALAVAATSTQYTLKISRFPTIAARATVQRGTVGASFSSSPIYCGAGGAAVPFGLGPADVKANGSFVATGIRRIAIGPYKGQIGTRYSLSGTIAHGRLSGKLTTRWYSDRKLQKACSGSSSVRGAAEQS